MASSRAPALTPLHIDKQRAPSSPSAMSPDSFMENVPALHSRTGSSSSSSSAGSSDPGGIYSSYSSGGKKPTSPKNVYTHCGRHTDQYLFGGKGFTDIWKAITKKD